MTKAVLTGVVAATAMAAASTTALAATDGLPLYRADHQAERFLEHGLRSWAGVNLRTDFVAAFCINGYYSRHEQRTGNHFPQGHQNRVGEDTFRSFACTLTADARTFHLYVVTARTGWLVRADR